MEADCLFCKIGSGLIPAKIVYQNEKVIAFLDINPAGTLQGHTLVMPKTHCASITDCSSEDLAAVMDTIKIIVPAVREISGASGINILRNEGKVAGELIPHLHFHIMPRVEGDGIHFEENRHNASEEELKTTHGKMLDYLKDKI